MMSNPTHADAPIPRLKRRITFTNTEAWCRASATKVHELSRRGVETYAYTPIRKLGAGESAMTKAIDRPAMFVGYLDDAVILPGTPTFMAPDGSIPAEGFLSKPSVVAVNLQAFSDVQLRPALDECANKGRGEAEIRLPIETAAIDGEAIFLGGNVNFGHFLDECLLRISLFDDIPEARGKPVLIYDYIPQRFADFMELAGVAKSRIVRIPLAATISCERLWFATLPVHRQFNGTVAVWPDAIHRLRAKMLPNIPSTAREMRKRLFIPRGQGGDRRLVNQDEVFAALQRYDFTSVNLEAYSAIDQLALVGTCDAMAGAIGAGMSISMLAPDDSVILQLAANEAFAMYNSEIPALVTHQKFAIIAGHKDAAPENQRGTLYDDYAVPAERVASMLEIAFNREGA